ncbi:MAG: hypothetical protein ABSG33_03500 [Candidatus Bathyarchaeia archaeon]|jgi:hypothetical protein
MKRPSIKILLFVALAALVLSIVLAAVSLYPGGSQSYASKSTLTLSPNETYTEGLGAFRGGENITLWVQSPTAFQKNFSIMVPIVEYVLTLSNTTYSITTDSNITYSFIATPNYYEAVFVSNSPAPGIINLRISVQEPNVALPYSRLNDASKILFFASLVSAMLLTLKSATSKVNSSKLSMPSLSKKNRRVLLILLLISLVVWLTIAIFNSNPLATFENWYTDNARDSYVSSLFLKNGFSVFSQPLGKLSNLDTSPYKYVTWPEMPQLYPLGSIFLFLPFGVLLQNGFNPTLIYKIEIVIFLLFATVGVYFFLKYLMQKDMPLILRLFGVYIVYVSLVVYAADGMFDSVAFLFSLFAIFMFLTERYDYFFLLVAISVFFKYQAGIFLFPLILVGLIKLFQENKPRSLATNKAVIGGLIFGFASISTALLSAPYLLATSSQFIMNGINAFATNTGISWSLQTFSILMTLTVTLAYAIYMLNKNSLLSLSAFFLLLPSFMLPYFQNWYMPFIFVYVLIPQRKKELIATTLWLTFLVVVLAVSGSNYQPIPLILQYLHL